jgi:hypothetical protein
MKPLAIAASAFAAALFLGACDQQSFKETRQLHSKYMHHDDHGRSKESADHGHAKETGKDAHAAEPAAHGAEKKAH